MDAHVEGRVRNRIERARSKLKAAEHLLSAGDLDDAVSRAYYGAFHAAQALLLTVGLQAKSHDATLSLFGLHFVKTGLVGAVHARALRAIKEDRENGDYAEVSFFEPQEVADRLASARAFVEAAVEFLARTHGLTGL